MWADKAQRYWLYLGMIYYGFLIKNKINCRNKIVNSKKYQLKKWKTESIELEQKVSERTKVLQEALNELSDSTATLLKWLSSLYNS